MGKLKRTLKQSKKILIIIAVLWTILAIVLVSPIAYSIKEATEMYESKYGTKLV